MPIFCYTWLFCLKLYLPFPYQLPYNSYNTAIHSNRIRIIKNCIRTKYLYTSNLQSVQTKHSTAKTGPWQNECAENASQHEWRLRNSSIHARDVTDSKSGNPRMACTAFWKKSKSGHSHIHDFLCNLVLRCLLHRESLLLLLRVCYLGVMVVSSRFSCGRASFPVKFNPKKADGETCLTVRSEIVKVLRTKKYILWLWIWWYR